MLNTIDIPQIIQDAHNFDFWGEQTMDADISKVVSEFLDELANSKIDFVLVGGIAMLAYVRGRNTKDIDLIVAISDLQQIAALQVTYQDSDFARADFRGLQIDILKTQNKFFDFVRREYVVQDKIQDRSISIATPEGLVLLKLFALPSLYRQGIFDRVALYETDITILMQQYPIHSENLVATLKPFLSETDADSLRDILKDIDNRIRRFRERPTDYKA